MIYISHKQIRIIRLIRGIKRNPEDGRFILVYRLGEDGDLMKYGAVMLQFWTLRASSYKTKAEV